MKEDEFEEMNPDMLARLSLLRSSVFENGKWCHGNDFYYFGLVDILQIYNSKKQLETQVKGLVHKKNTISSMSASKYAERFYKFIAEAISGEQLEKHEQPSFTKIKTMRLKLSTATLSLFCLFVC